MYIIVTIIMSHLIIVNTLCLFNCYDTRWKDFLPTSIMRAFSANVFVAHSAHRRVMTQYDAASHAAFDSLRSYSLTIRLAAKQDVLIAFL